MFGLAELLQRKVRLAPQGVDGFFHPAPENYCGPGYWVALAARGRARNVQFQDLRLPGGGRDTRRRSALKWHSAKRTPTPISAAERERLIALW